MKNIISTLIFITLSFITLKNNGQSLIEKKWMVEEYGISNNIKYGIDKSIKPLAVFFSKDSLNNKVNYSNIEMRFLNNGTYQGKNALGTVYNGTWHLNNTSDSLTTDSTTSIFHFINPLSCITNNMTIQKIDTLGTVDTFYTYVKLYGINEIPTSQKENTMSISNIKVYPTPASEVINIEFSPESLRNIKEARLYNLYGQLVKVIVIGDKPVNTMKVNIEEINKGYYFLEFISNVGRSRIGIKKIIKG
ncbi:MAG: T9SS type A sorting domain-containing protein [Bacteroidia bacterium]